MFEYVDNAQKLNDLLARLESAEWVTLDTEFIREKTYYPRLCLIQIASTDVLACIDPLQISIYNRSYNGCATLRSSCCTLRRKIWKFSTIWVMAHYPPPYLIHKSPLPF